MTKPKISAFSLYFTLLLSTTPLFSIADADTPRGSSKSQNDGVPAQELWCVARNNADDAALQAAINWACSAGGADCAPIQQGGPCYDPSNILNTASYAFNDYFRKHGLSDDSCNFDNNAAITSINPSQSFSLYLLRCRFVADFKFFLLAGYLFKVSFLSWDSKCLMSLILKPWRLKFLFLAVMWFAYSCNISHSFEFQVSVIANCHPGNSSKFSIMFNQEMWFLLVCKS